MSDSGSPTPKKGRGPGKPFTGGDDPRRNAAGRMKGVEQRTRAVIEARSYTAADGNTYTGFDALIHLHLDIAYSSNERTKDRLQAAGAALDRGYGKPKQALEVSGGVPEEQLAALEALRMTPHERRQAMEAQDSTAPANEDVSAEAEMPIE
jgi:hypothetical protein